MNFQFIMIKILIIIWSRFAPLSCARFLVNLLFKVRKKQSGNNGEMPVADSIRYLASSTTLSYWQGTEQKAVLFVHGWNGSGNQFSLLFDLFRSQGYSIYIVQPKGYGLSSSSLSNPGDFVRSIKVSLNHIDEILVATIGHSMGAGALLHVAATQVDLGNIVSISAPSDFKKLLSDFCGKLSVSNRSRDFFYSCVEEVVKIKHAELHIENSVSYLNKPTLFIHDEGDRVVPIQNALSLHSRLPASELYLTNGLGHTRILKSKTVVRKIFDFCIRGY